MCIYIRYIISYQAKHKTANQIYLSLTLKAKKYTMIGTRKLIKIARKSQEMASIRPKSLAKAGAFRDRNTDLMTKVEKGHFVVYTLDGHRFVFPLDNLKTYIFRELLAMSAEEFGLSSSGPITFSCDASFLKDATNLINKNVTIDMQRALIQSLFAKSNYPTCYVYQETTMQQLVAHAC